MHRTLLPVLLLAACATDPHAPDPDRIARQVTAETPDVADVVEGNTTFALDLYATLVADAPDANLFYSPLSISSALGMTSAGAAGTTATEMSDVLHKTVDEDAWHSAFGALTTDLNGDKKRGYTLHIANRLFPAEGFTLLDDFATTCEEDWGAPAETLDYAGDAEGARAHINAWVAEQTADHIQDLLPGGSLTAATQLVLANAITFEADWWTQFDPADTGDGTFTLADGSTVTAPMMSLATGSLENHRIRALVDADGTTIGRLPYEDDEVAAYVVVPAEHDGLDEVEAGLDAATLQSWADQLYQPDNEGGSELYLQLPSFELRWAQELSAPLAALGMPSLFDPGSADLSGINGTGGLYVDGVYHQAWMKLDESGTEAAAATAVVTNELSAAVVSELVADHPFLVVLRDDLTGSVLFVARIMDPTAG